METYFEIVNVPVAIESNSRRFLKDVGDIFHYFKAPRPDLYLDDNNSFHVSIGPISTIVHGDRVIYQSSNYRYILEYLEYQIYNFLIDRLSNYYLIHAGVVSWHNNALLLPARSGGGKTTLIASLIKNGLKYLTDEIAIIEPRTLMIYPFPKPLNIKTGSLPLFPDLEPQMEFINKIDIGIEDKIHHVFVKNNSIHPLDKPIPLNSIVFVQYKPGIHCRLTQISKAWTIFELIKCSFNQYLFKEEGIDLLNRLVAHGKCYHLQLSCLDEAITLIKGRLLVNSDFDGFINRREHTPSGVTSGL